MLPTPNSSFWPYDVILSSTELTIHHRGPPLEIGPLPTFIYFALSGEESLNLDPINQPVEFLGKENIRVFSFTLPGHDQPQEKRYSISSWRKEIESNHNFIPPFIQAAMKNIDFLIEKGFINRHHLGVAGLSRGAFMAAHLAALDNRIKVILGFAPITQLDFLEDFREIENPLVQALSLSNIVEALYDKCLRFYIGNRDLRVGTANCFHFIHELSEKAHQHGHRSPPIELRIYPSIGYKGHGTPPEIFTEGAQWIKTMLM